MIVENFWLSGVDVGTLSNHVKFSVFILFSLLLLLFACVIVSTLTDDACALDKVLSFIIKC